MNITIIGTGYVGLVSGICFVEFGFNVACVDKDKNKIQDLKDGKVPIYEPGLDAILKRNIEANRITKKVVPAAYNTEFQVNNQNLLSTSKLV